MCSSELGHGISNISTSAIGLPDKIIFIEFPLQEWIDNEQWIRR